MDEVDTRRPTQKSKSFSGADKIRSRTTVSGITTAETADDDDNAGNRRSVSKSGAMNENRRREQNDLVRRQTVTANGGLWPVDHKDVSTCK